MDAVRRSPTREDKTMERNGLRSQLESILQLRKYYSMLGLVLVVQHRNNFTHLSFPLTGVNSTVFAWCDSMIPF